MEVIEPEFLVVLGATAAQSLLGRTFRITKERGKLLKTDWAPWTMATYHPSALLRAPDEESRHQMYDELVHDLSVIAKKL